MLGRQSKCHSAYDDLADYERRCKARDTHADFPAYLSASAHLITAQETRLIRAAPMPVLHSQRT